MSRQFRDGHLHRGLPSRYAWDDHRNGRNSGGGCGLYKSTISPSLRMPLHRHEVDPVLVLTERVGTDTYQSNHIFHALIEEVIG